MAWRLGAVVRGEAGPAVLRSYEPERKKIAQDNAELSLKNLDRVFQIMRLLNINPDHADLLVKSLHVPPLSLLPESARNAAFAAAMQTGRLPLAALEEQNLLGRTLARRAKEFLEQGRGLGMLFDGQDLGLSHNPAHTLADPMTYTPRVEVGLRLPHLPLHSVGSDVKTVVPEPRSLLHAATGHRFALLLNGRKFSPFAVFTLEDKFPELQLIIYYASTDSVPDTLHPMHVALSGLADSPLSSAAAVLVRPDQHVAWVSETAKGDWDGLARVVREHALQASRGCSSC